MKTTLSILSALSILAVAPPAFAQYASSPGASSGVTGEFTQLDRQSPVSQFGVDFGGAYWHSDFLDNITAVRIDLHGHYTAPNGFGFYGSLPIVRTFSDEDDVTGTGNLDVGGFKVLDTGSPWQVILRGGLFLATADEGEGSFANILGYPARLTDFYSVFPDSTTLRLSASPIIRSGNGFFRADLGLDLPLSEPDGADTEPLLRANFGGGGDLGSARLMGELIFMHAFSDVDDDDNTIVSAAITARFGKDLVRPGVSLGSIIYVPDSDSDDYLFDPLLLIFSLQFVPQI
ncbi:MAG TPA: hypothetical protein VFG83_06585 [Kofleriaceae bacterium]|nr:hypothetical protein [Kofleriaceae bacterium]